MKTLIVVKSIHHGNTKKIAKRMAEVLNADLMDPSEFDPDTLVEYDLIGFGSGIYGYKHHRSILDLVEKAEGLAGKKVFIFSTSGMKVKDQHGSLKKVLSKKEVEIVDEFFCKGLDTNSFLKYFGGINKGRPNEEDLKKAEDFANNLIVNR